MELRTLVFEKAGRANTEATLQIARATEGDRESLTWLVEHLSPLLRSHARFRQRVQPAAQRHHPAGIQRLLRRQADQPLRIGPTLSFACRRTQIAVLALRQRRVGQRAGARLHVHG